MIEFAFTRVSVLIWLSWARQSTLAIKCDVTRSYAAIWHLAFREAFLFHGSRQPTLHFEGVKIIPLFFWTGDIWTAPFRAGGALWTACVYSFNKRTAIYMRLNRGIIILYIFVVYQHLKSTCAVVCSEFKPWIFVLNFMPKDLHFACVHTAYRVRQRILTTYHYHAISFFSARPPVHFGDCKLTETKNI